MGTMRNDLLGKLREVGRPVEEQEKIIEYGVLVFWWCRTYGTPRAGFCWSWVHLAVKIPCGRTLIASTSISRLL